MLISELGLALDQNDARSTRAALMQEPEQGTSVEAADNIPPGSHVRPSRPRLTIAQLAEHLTVESTCRHQSVLGSIPSGENLPTAMDERDLFVAPQKQYVFQPPLRLVILLLDNSESPSIHA